MIMTRAGLEQREGEECPAAVVPAGQVRCLDPAVALERVRGHATRLPAERSALLPALDRRLHREVRAPGDNPPRAVSAMDGYAVRAGDLRRACVDEPVLLCLVGSQPAGHAPSLAVGAREAVAVGTGAVLPVGADAVVVAEAVDVLRVRRGRSGGCERLLRVRARVVAGENVRAAGEEYVHGEVLLPERARLTPAALGLLASAGIAEVEVHVRPRVALLVTGDEIALAGRPTGAARLRPDCDGPLVEALCQRAGAAVVRAAHLGDDEHAVARWIAEAAPGVDVLLTTGGASVGERDVVERAWGLAGVVTVFRGVEMRPGKRLRFGIHRAGAGARPCLVFALSGNPLAALTQFDLFVHPLLGYLAGAPWDERPRVRAPLDAGGAVEGGKVPRHHRARLEGAAEESRLCIPPGTGSGMLRGAAAGPFTVCPSRAGRGIPDAPVEAIAATEAMLGRTWRPAPPLPRLLAVRGPSGSGKTTLIEALIPRLAARGLRVGTIKHAHHGAMLDVPGKDSHRHASAGAACVLLLAPGQAGFFVPRAAEPEPGAWLEYFAGRADLVLVEGYSRIPIPSVTLAPPDGGVASFEESDAEPGPAWTLRVPRQDPGTFALPIPLVEDVAGAVAGRLGLP